MTIVSGPHNLHLLCRCLFFFRPSSLVPSYSLLYVHLFLVEVIETASPCCLLSYRTALSLSLLCTVRKENLIESLFSFLSAFCCCRHSPARAPSLSTCSPHHFHGARTTGAEEKKNPGCTIYHWRNKSDCCRRRRRRSSHHFSLEQSSSPRRRMGGKRRQKWIVESH